MTTDEAPLKLNPKALERTKLLIAGSAGGLSANAEALIAPQKNTGEQQPATPGGLPRVSTRRVTLIDCTECGNGIMAVEDTKQVDAAKEAHKSYHREHTSRLDYWLRQAQEIRAQGNPPQSPKAVLDMIVAHWEGHGCCVLMDCDEAKVIWQNAPDDLKFQTQLNVELLSSYTEAFNAELDKMWGPMPDVTGILQERPGE